MFNRAIPPITKNLLIINGLFFLATIIFEQRGINLRVFLGAFYPESINFKPWQLLTHMFMHGDFSHILFNMFALWMFGSAVEQTLGQKKYLILYLLAGFGGFTLFNFTNYLQVESLKPIVEELDYSIKEIISTKQTIVPGQSIAFSGNVAEQARELLSYYITPMVGASGAIYGLLVAFGVMYPNAKLALIFFPVPVKAKYFIPGIILLELYMGISNYSWNPIANFAHLGGALIGFLLVRYWKKQNQNRYQI